MSDVTDPQPIKEVGIWSDDGVGGAPAGPAIGALPGRAANWSFAHIKSPVVRWFSSGSKAQARLLNNAEMELGVLSQKLSRRWGLTSTVLNIGLRFNSRLTRSFARYRRDTGVIELGPRFFRLRGRHKEVLCHELAHVAVDYLYGKQAQPHGNEWRKLVESAGFIPTARLPAKRACHAEKVTKQGTPAVGLARRPTTFRYVYEHRCPVCQMTQRAKRSVSQWRCAQCVTAGLSGALEITRVMRQ